MGTADSVKGCACYTCCMNKSMTDITRDTLQMIAKIPNEVEIKAPSHYVVGGIDNIDYMRAKLSPEMLEGFFMGNVLKYLVRYPHKGEPVKDLKKAQVYLNWLVELKEKNGNS